MVADVTADAAVEMKIHKTGNDVAAGGVDDLPGRSAV